MNDKRLGVLFQCPHQTRQAQKYPGVAVTFTSSFLPTLVTSPAWIHDRLQSRGPFLCCWCFSCLLTVCAVAITARRSLWLKLQCSNLTVLAELQTCCNMCYQLAHANTISCLVIAYFLAVTIYITGVLAS